MGRLDLHVPDVGRDKVEFDIVSLGAKLRRRMIDDPDRKFIAQVPGAGGQGGRANDEQGEGEGRQAHGNIRSEASPRV